MNKLKLIDRSDIKYIIFSILFSIVLIGFLIYTYLYTASPYKNRNNYEDVNITDNFVIYGNSVKNLDNGNIISISDKDVEYFLIYSETEDQEINVLERIYHAPRGNDTFSKNILQIKVYTPYKEDVINEN